jgi:hypothetical protein
VNSDARITTTDALITLNVVVDLPVALNCFAAVEQPTTTTSVPASTTTTTTSTITTSTTLSGL